MSLQITPEGLEATMKLLSGTGSDALKIFLEGFSNKAASEHPVLTLDEKISTISKWYRSENMVLTLGAGASRAYGLPDWNTLLQKLLLVTLNSNSSEAEDDVTMKRASVIAKTFTKVFNPSPVIAARFLHNHYSKKNPGSKLAFENAVRHALYDEINDKNTSALLKEIRHYCIAAGKSPNLNDIITYNYDDLLEVCLQNAEAEIPFTPIYSSGNQSDENTLSIFHVHGFLPRKRKLTTKNKIVLSDDEYHQQYTDIYGWSNLIQINKFKDSHCLFVGLSFTDPNLRRLLDVAMKERGDDKIHHYCIKTKYSTEKVQKMLEKVLQDNESIQQDKNNANINISDVSAELTKLMEKFEESDAYSFGIGTIWVDSHDDIPGILRKIRLK